MRYFADYIKGKPYQKTVLWENSDVSSAFASQNITLSDSITNYDEIGILHCASNSDLNKLCTTYVSVKDFVQLNSSDSLMLGMRNSNRTRSANYVDETTIFIDGCKQINNSGTYNNNLVPIKVIGIKKGLGECVKIKTGTLSFMLAETTKEIDTGLSEINKFMLFARHSDAEISTSAVQCSLLYDADKSISTHCIVGSLGTGSSYSTSNPQQAIGTSVQRGITINSIVDGKVTISNSGANNANWNDWGVVYWVAIGE